MPIAPGSRSKIDRALFHLQQLASVMNAYSQLPAYEATWRITYEPTPVHTLWARKAHEVPPESALIVGDTVHNARCALDYVVYRLSSLPADSSERRNIWFPIIMRPRDWRGVNTRELNGVSQLAIDQMRAWQPFVRQQRDDPLYLLQQISNADKHHAIRVVASRLLLSDVFVSGTIGFGNRVTNFPLPRPLPSHFRAFGSTGKFEYLGDGVLTATATPVARLTLGQSDNLQVQAVFGAGLSFGDGQGAISGRDVVGTLDNIVRRVLEVCEDLP